MASMPPLRLGGGDGLLLTQLVACAAAPARDGQHSLSIIRAKQLYFIFENSNPAQE